MLPFSTRVMIICSSAREVARVEGLFNEIGYNYCQNGNSFAVAIARLHCDTTGLIYVDWNIDSPDNAISAIQKIRGDYKIKHLPILMTCETRDISWARNWYNSNIVQGWLLKPVSKSALEAALAPLTEPIYSSFNI